MKKRVSLRESIGKANSILALEFQKTIKIYTLLAFLASSFTVSLAHADSKSNDEYLTEDDVFGDIPMVTSGSRFEQKQAEAPVSITVIDSEMIEASGATEVYELMRFAPGFFAYSVYANQFGVATRSSPANFPSQLEVMVNGRSVYMSVLSTVEWSSLGIDVADIDYIEIARGPSAAVYGSNAFFGAINIVTKRSVARPKSSARVAFGNISRRGVSLNYSGNIGDVNYGSSLVYRTNEGFEPVSEVKNTQAMVDGRESLHFSVTGDYTPTAIDEIEFDFGVGFSNLELPVFDVRGYFNREFKDNYQRIKWTRNHEDRENSVQFYHNYIGIDEDNQLGLVSDLLGIAPAQVPIATGGQPDQVLESGIRNGISQRFDLEVEQINRSLENLTFVVGAGVRVNRVKSVYLLGTDDDDESETKYRFFANGDWRFNDYLNANLGVMVEDTRFADTLVSPRASLNWQLNGNHAFRIGAARGKRAPTIVEAEEDSAIYFADGSVADVSSDSVDNLHEETITSYEVGYIAHFPNTRTALDARVFWEEVRDGINIRDTPFPDADGEVLVNHNYIEYDTKGFELQLSQRFSDSFLARLAYGYIDIDGEFARDLADPTDITLITGSLPFHSANLLLQKTFANGFVVSSWIQYQSDSESVDGKFVEEFTRVDLRLAKRISYGNTNGLVELVAHNLFGNYTDFEEDHIFKTRAFLRVQLDFQ